MSATRDKFFEQHFLQVTDFLAPKQARELAAAVIAAQGPPDGQCPNAGAVYNQAFLLEVLCEKVATVNKLIGEPVLPTYVYARAYKKGSVLHRHTDRPACEISLTVNLDCSKVWPVWIASPKGDSAVHLEPGDAMLYWGETPHWRKPFTGKHCTQAFMHYVRARGPYSNFYFDRKPT